MSGVRCQEKPLRRNAVRISLIAASLSPLDYNGWRFASFSGWDSRLGRLFPRDELVQVVAERAIGAESLLVE